MKKTLLLSVIAMLTITYGQSQLSIKNLLCENTINPVGLDNTRPQLSWQLGSPVRNTLQTAYEIRVAETTPDVVKGKNLVWNSGRITSDQSVYIPYDGKPLLSGRKYYWQVRAWDNHGNASGWSQPASWQMGFLQTSDWKAKWIQAATEDSIIRINPIFRKTFSVTKKVKTAALYITAHGLYESCINGHRAGDAYLTPGFTSYNKRTQYQVYDVTEMLQNGKNVLAVTLGNGWYRGNLAWARGKDVYGKDASLLAQLNITYTDGTAEAIISDENWKSSTGAIRGSEIYHGETIDARLEKEGWKTAGYDDASWNGVKTAAYGYDNLVATINEPVRKHEQFKPVKIFTTPAGEWVIDFGQNLVGFVQVKVSGKAGDKIVIDHAEVLDKEGNFYTANLRAARQQNTYILKGGKEELFEPHFTFQGFRYIRITGFPGEIKPENFTAIALYSDMKPAGTLVTSHALLNQLQHNIQWGQKGNFLDIPTDCPQRDERLGWTGDAQAFSRTAAFNMQVHNFFRKWLKDLAADQLANGSVPHVIPNVIRPDDAGATGWADAATIIPWNMYLAYGDKRILEDQYPSMKAWIGYMEKQSRNDLWNTGYHFGDWLFYRPDDDNDGRSAVTDKYMIAQCFYAHSVQLMINTATVLGKPGDVDYYSNLLQRIKAAYLKEYVTPGGRLVSGTQTAYVLALNFDMLPEDMRPGIAARLAENIRSYNYHLTTGFLGTPYLCHVLTRFGYHDLAFTLLMQETYPSWLYPVKMGATTIWERWDGQKPDRTFQSPGMNSFNHYAYGAIGDWMYRVLAGINTDTEKPGYKKIIIRPFTDGKVIRNNTLSTQGLSSIAADLQTYYGTVSSHWRKENDRLVLDVEIPANTTADIYLPTGDAAAVKEGGNPITAAPDLFRVKEKQANYVVIGAGSGRYSFTW